MKTQHMLSWCRPTSVTPCPLGLPLSSLQCPPPHTSSPPSQPPLPSACDQKTPLGVPGLTLSTPDPGVLPLRRAGVAKQTPSEQTPLQTPISWLGFVVSLTAISTLVTLRLCKSPRGQDGADPRRLPELGLELFLLVISVRAKKLTCSSTHEGISAFRKHFFTQRASKHP